MTDLTFATQAIRDSVSARQIGEDYGLNPGRDGRCPCIFCSGDRKDTLKLYDGSRGAYCFRCHRSADVIALVMEATGQNFPQAVRDINSRYGLGLPLDNPDPDRERKARAEAERRKRERAEKEKRDREMLDAYWDACDKVAIAEEVLRTEGPRTPDERFSARYVKCANKIHELRYERDRLHELVYPNR